MRAGISFHRGPPASDVVFQHPIMEDPPSLLVDSNSPWQIPYSPLISEEPLIVGLILQPSISTQVSLQEASDSSSAVGGLMSPSVYQAGTSRMASYSVSVRSVGV